MDSAIPDRPCRLGPSVPRRGNAFSRGLARLILRLMGWRVVGEPPDFPRFIMTAAPHTSNWDGAIFLLAIIAMGLDLHWIGKHTLFDGMMGRPLRWMGGIRVDRGKAQDIVGQVAAQFAQHEKLAVVVAPEGTRRPVTRWKSGFYRMAQAANVPILLGFMDYRLKRVGFGPVLEVSGDLGQDIQRMAAFYRQVTPRVPERFCMPEAAT